MPTIFKNKSTLLRRAKNQEGNISTEIISLTPEFASELLQRNFDNRNVTKSRVEAFASDIKNDRWIFNGESIIVSDGGELNDGQHRCRAVILADKPIKTLIVFGVPRAARFTTDQGGARTAGHFLSMNGVKDSNVVARVAAVLLQIEKNSGELYQSQSGVKSQMTKQEVLDYAYQIMGKIDEFHSVGSKAAMRKMTSPANFIAAAIFISEYSDDYPAIHEFFEGISSGAGLSATSPIFRARERLINEKIAGSITAHKVFEIIIRSWNAWRNGKIIRQFVTGHWPDVSE